MGRPNGSDGHGDLGAFSGREEVIDASNDSDFAWFRTSPWSLAAQQLQAPVVAALELARRVLDLALSHQLKPQPPANGIRAVVVHGGEGVHVAVPRRRPQQVKSLRRCRGGYATPLERRQHRPADLVDLLITPTPFPI